jgi:hypothetical protein
MSDDAASPFNADMPSHSHLNAPARNGHRRIDRDDDPTMAQSDQTCLQDDDHTHRPPAPAPPATPPDKTPPVMTIDAWLEKLRRSDRAFYNIMAMEVWSLAKSMDSLLPGFWSRFMENRRSAMQEFVERRREPSEPTPRPEDGEPTQQQP